MVIDGKFLTNMLSLLAGEDVSIRTYRDKTCTLSSGTAQYELVIHPASNYPKPEMPFPEGAVKASNISTLAKSTVFAASKSENQLVMKGIRLEINGNSIRACGSDGIRLMERRQETEKGRKLNLIIPSHSFRLLADLVSDKDTLEVGIVGTSAVFLKDGFLFSTNLISGVYIDVDRVISGLRPEYSAVVDTGVVYKALHSVSVVAGDTGRVNVSLKRDSIQITLTSDTGRSQTSVPGVVMKETPESGFYYSIGYLLEAFRRLSGTAELQFSQIGMLSVRTGNELYFQVPMREPAKTKKVKTSEPAKKKEAA
jgi:DNA polymerase III sliding clamp (beta) subunit (PCNA family)